MKTLNILLIITGGMFVYNQPVAKSSKKAHINNVNYCIKAKATCVG